MINLGQQTMTVFGGTQPVQIQRWEVWFQTAMGLHDKLDDAIQCCLKCDFDPQLMILPVTVAICEFDGKQAYEVYREN